MRRRIGRQEIQSNLHYGEGNPSQAHGPESNGSRGSTIRCTLLYTCSIHTEIVK